MKYELFENDYSFSLIITPEQADEFAKLLRTAHNAKQEPPLVNFSFGGSVPYFSIDIKKLPKHLQVNHIAPHTKRKK